MPDELRTARLTDLLTRQQNAVTSAQLVELGYSRREIAGLVARGHLVRVSRGVMTSAPAMSVDSWWMTALLVHDDGSALSHPSAAAIWGVCRIAARELPPGDPVHVTSSKRRASAPFIVAHRSDPGATVLRNGLRVTSLERTIIDLASMRSVQQLTNILHEAEAIDRKINVKVSEELERRPAVRGAPALRDALELNRRGLRGTRSELEDEFDRFLDRHGIERPELNVPMLTSLGWIEIDVLWRAALLAVELDSGWHDRSRNRRDDPRRDAALAEEGIDTFRLRWVDLTVHEARSVRTIQRRLGERQR